MANDEGLEGIKKIDAEKRRSSSQQSNTKTKKQNTPISEDTESLKEKIYLLFNIPFLIKKTENPFTKHDFEIEAQAVERLIDKFNIIGKIFETLDSLIVLLMIINKYRQAYKKENETDKKEGVQNETSDN